MTPAISAILTTHNRGHLLPQVLDGLQRQTLPASGFEVLAVDDGSSDNTLDILAGYSKRLPLRVLRQEASGIAAARNLGIFNAQAPLVIFVDDDDVADPGLLMAHLAAHNAYADLATAVLGHTRLDPSVAWSPLMRHVTETGCQLFSYGWMKEGELLGYKEFWGGRSSCKRAFLLEHGVFNPVFRFGCEDIECAWRLRPHGLRVIYEPAASASMIRMLSFDEFCRRSYLQGRSQFLFSQLHPEDEVRDYCQIERAHDAWGKSWLHYSSILRRARELDRLATIQVQAGLALSGRFQERLDAAYREAFFLSCAKGVADGAFLKKTAPASRPSAYGLPGNFADLMSRLDSARTYPEGSKRYMTLSDQAPGHAATI